ncbi:GNAT family N-acetyltransferase [Reyranella sp. CPCC 100927]|uniref:GNAT family N-acetyltransferase n=1 Tax=Reyranella sp. CPCC 100927 TaxID=2599616 RepID=UPI0011B48763|nr:GNAT family N-acyltransferase [Reyranella sp. CPCC 100927]TWT15517.1 GNAT family N-acetyltransferase [Reyranella sp. CPCC 100927]
MTSVALRAAALRPGADALPPIVAGDFEVRLARNEAEVEAAQALRYKVFYEEMTAKPTPEMAALRRDYDDFDPLCDHLLFIDRRRPGLAGITGTYRLIRRSAAAARGSFYSVSEYDVAPLVGWPGEILELGRSCVDASARSMPAMQLMWRGIATYVFHYDIEIMFGCASLPGTDLQRLAQPLSYLAQNHMAPPELRARALPSRYVDMNILPAGSYDTRVAERMVPPLIKGYLRLGGFVGDGAVIDSQFDTTDVCIVVKTDLITEKYYRHYERVARETGAI